MTAKLHTVLFEIYLQDFKKLYCSEQKEELEPKYGNQWENICLDKWKETDISLIKKGFDTEYSSSYYHRLYGFIYGIYDYINNTNTDRTNTDDYTKKEIKKNIKSKDIDLITRIYIKAIMNLKTTKITSFYSKVKNKKFLKITTDEKIDFFNKFIDELYLEVPITENNNDLFKYASNKFKSQNLSEDKIIYKWNSLINIEKKKFDKSIEIENNISKFLNKFNDEIKEKLQNILIIEQGKNILFPSNYHKNIENTDAMILDSISILHFDEKESKKLINKLKTLISSVYELLNRFVSI